MIVIEGEIAVALKKVVLTNITLCETPRTMRFFVRYRWSGIPTSIDARTYRWNVSGNVSTVLELSLAELKQLAAPVDLIPVNQCSGNSRGHLTAYTNGGRRTGIFQWPGHATDLPLLRGYSVRLIVPGHYRMNRVKPVNAIIVADKVFDGFWMSGSGRAAPRTINWICATA